MSQDSHIYTRQAGFFNPEKQRINLRIFGAGSVGSFLTLTLAKLGFNDISVFDFDKIEPHNLPNQFYRYKDLGKPKVEALKEIIKEFSDCDISIINEKITQENCSHLILGRVDLSSMVILCFDNLESRRIIYNQLKGMPISLMDLRMGGLGYSLEIVKLDNEKECKAYETSLNKETKELVCGQQSIIFTLLSIASEASNIIVKINNNQAYPSILKRNMSRYLILTNAGAVKGN